MKKNKNYTILLTLGIMVGSSVGYFGAQLYDYISEQVALTSEKRKFDGIEDIMQKSRNGRILATKKSKKL